MENDDEQALARGRATLWAQCDALLAIKRLQGRELTEAESAQFYHLVEVCGLIDIILDRAAERRRRECKALGKPLPPRPVTIVVRPRRTRCRRSRPLNARIRSAARAGSPQRRAAAGAGADDPDPDPARILGRFQKTCAWALLSPTGRREIIALANGDPAGSLGDDWQTEGSA